MRFVKRGKFRAPTSARKSHKPPEYNILGNVATEERSALLADTEPQDTGPDPDDVVHADPTQQLLTILGRFEKHVNLAQSNLARGDWTDACMEQLINATEIAVDRKWTELVHALTRTAQVLQSYEDAGKARSGIPFLRESYKILCLMVGDLIVGKIREGVMDKWHSSYTAAAEDMRAAGIALVSLDVESEEGARDEVKQPMVQVVDARASRAAAAKSSPFRNPSIDDTSDYELDELPTLDELPPLEDDLDDEREAEQTDFVDEPAVEDELAYEDVKEELEPVSEVESYEDEPVDDAAPSADAVEAVEESEPEAPAEECIPQEIADVLDRLCEPLSLIDRIPEDRDHGPVFDTLNKSIVQLKAYATENALTKTEALCDSLTELCHQAYLNDQAHDDRFLDLVYAFCGHYVETTTNAEYEPANAWMKDCETLAAEWNAGLAPAAAPSAASSVADAPVEDAAYDEALDASEVIEADESRAVVEDLPGLEDDEEFDASDEIDLDQEPDSTIIPFESAGGAESRVKKEEAIHSIEVLLSTARGAMTEGNSARAKVLAMKAVGNIALVEADQAQGELEQAERRLRKSHEAIAIARARVREEEKKVKAAVDEVASGQDSLAERQHARTEADKELETLRGRVAEIENQIRRLQEKRDHIARKATESEKKLDQEKTAEAETERKLEHLLEAEEDSRTALENARQEVKSIHRESSDAESAMERAREDLNGKRAALADIEETISQLLQGSSEAAESENLLF